MGWDHNYKPPKGASIYGSHGAPRGETRTASQFTSERQPERWQRLGDVGKRTRMAETMLFEALMTKLEAGDFKRPADILVAWQAMADRAYGKPTTHVERGTNPVEDMTAEQVEAAIDAIREQLAGRSEAVGSPEGEAGSGEQA